MKSVSLLLALCISSASAQPSGYHVGAPAVLPDSVVETLAGGRFQASIIRVAANASDAQLIAAAERLYPAPNAIVATAATARERDRLLATAAGVPLGRLTIPQRAAGNPSDRWWLETFDETWIPFAVTGSAVSYYLGRLHDYAAGLGPFGGKHPEVLDHGSFSYTAKLLPSSEPNSARVVELRLEWTYWCGMLCAIEFIHTRRVFFNAAGQAVRVDGDGRPTVVVS